MSAAGGGRPAGPRGDRAALLPVLAAALVLRGWHLGARSVWTDEGTTWAAASGSVADLIRHCAARDASPPLYYLLTRVALGFGDSESHLRAVSVIASLGLVWLTYRLARLFAPRREAMLAAALVALSPYQLMYAQEARTYATVACLAVWSLYLFARGLRGAGRSTWIALALVQGLALYTQGIAALIVGVQAATVAFTAAGRRCWRPWALATLAAVALYLPWLFVSLAQAGHLSESHWYVPALGGHGVLRVLRAVFLSPVPLLPEPPGAPGLPRPVAWALLAAVPAVPLFSAARAALQRTAAGAMLRLMFAALLLPLLAVLVVSLREPLWLSRYFVFLGPPLAVLLAHGVLRLAPAALGRLWTVLLLGVAAWGCVRYDRDFDKEPWRELVARVARVAEPGRAVVLVPFDVAAFAYYDHRLGRPVEAYEVSHPEAPFASRYTAEQLEVMERAARERTRGAREVWVIVRSANSEARRQLARRVEAVAAEGRTLVERGRLESAGGPLRYARFANPGADTTAR